MSSSSNSRMREERGLVAKMRKGAVGQVLLDAINNEVAVKKQNCLHYKSHLLGS